MEQVKARKQYECAITNKKIEIGDMYIRLNHRRYGIFHFHYSCDQSTIIDFMMNNYIMDDMDEGTRQHMPMIWDEDERQIWRSMPDDF